MYKADLIYASSETSADMFYACGFNAPDPFVYFACKNEKSIILSALEQDRAQREVKPEIAILQRGDFVADAKAGTKELILALAQSRRIEEFRVPKDFPLALADELRKHALTINACEEDFFPERQYKNNQEVERINEALRVAEAGMKIAIDIIREASVNEKGILLWREEILTSELLRAEINIGMLRLGGFSDSTIVACGKDASEPHNTGSGALRANKSIIIDIFPRMKKSSYWGDLSRTLVKGKASALVKKAYQAVLEAREHAKTLIRPGAIPADIHQAAKNVLEEHGFNTGYQDGRNFGFFHGLGHGVGLEIHEKPAISPRNTEALKGGEIITVEPGLYYSEWGGVRLEDIVIVSPDGCKCLTQIEDILEL